MKHSFDIDVLRMVAAGIDLGSFARAAHHLGRSQSAASMQLKRLEEQTGTRLFVRKGRTLVPTEAGETLAAYARRIIALNDAAALALGASVTPATVRLGLPQDFFEDVMPATLSAFDAMQPGVHVEVRAGPNHILGDEIRAGRLDGAIVFTPAGSGSNEGELLCELPMRWLAGRARNPDHGTDGERVPLVMFDHPCLFRQAALAELERTGLRWRAAVTTPSLPGIWGALRSGLGVAVRTTHAMPDDVAPVPETDSLPRLPMIEVRLLRATDPGETAERLCDVLRAETLRLVAPAALGEPA
uniref:LysR substrate-binding domain-containing protein n=1 Tax=Stappia sp. TaxID=1870903 RepID=UPI003BAC99FB